MEARVSVAVDVSLGPVHQTPRDVGQKLKVLVRKTQVFEAGRGCQRPQSLLVHFVALQSRVTITNCHSIARIRKMLPGQLVLMLAREI